ncbi:diaminopimelate epimerase [Angustibacter aerolatus]
MSRALPFVKGHGTENDFVLVPDPDGALDLGADDVRALADRRAGIGADGVIRVVRAAAEPAAASQAGDAEWFMDYRNADGSVAEMCGNGVRVVVRYLLDEGLVGAGAFGLATRAGTKAVAVGADGVIAVDLGQWRLVGGQAALAAGGDAEVLVHGLPGGVAALSVDLGNPHTVLLLPGEADLAAADLTVAPVVRPEPEHGTNVELVVPLAPGHVAMRVHERGVGETRSCGTGAAAAALAARAWARSAALDAGEDPDEVPGTWRVDVPGDVLRVRVDGDRVELAGPAVLVARGTAVLPA